MRRRFTSQKNTNAKAEITVGYNVNDDKSKVIQNVKVNVCPTDGGKLERAATLPNLTSREINNDDSDGITLAEPGKEPVTVHYGSRLRQDAVQSLSPEGAYDTPKYVPPIENPYVTSLDTELMKIYRDIITDNYDSVINLIDDSGLIILPYEDLIHVIAVLCEVQDQDVKIQYFIDEDVSCCSSVAKLSPIKDINTIKVSKGGVTNDLNLSYNHIYNKIVDEYKISLERFFVKII